jgi:hypothetical protein
LLGLERNAKRQPSLREMSRLVRKKRDGSGLTKPTPANHPSPLAEPSSREVFNDNGNSLSIVIACNRNRRRKNFETFVKAAPA